MKKLLSGIILGVGLVVGATIYAGARGPFYDASAGGATELSTDLTPELGGDLDLEGFDVYGDDVATTDSTAGASSIGCGQSQFWGATSTSGGACYLSGGVGVRRIAIANNTLAGDTIVIAGIHNGAATSATWTWNAAGPAVGADVNASAVALVSYCNTNGPALGIASCACSDATCTGATPVVGFVPDTDTIRLTLTASDASQTVTSGADGQLLVPSGTAALPSVAFAADPNTGLYWVAADILALSTGGAYKFYCETSGNKCWATNFQSEGYLTAAAASAINWTGRTSLTSTADGKTKFANDGGSAGVVFDHTSSGVLNLRNLADDGGGQLFTASGPVSVGNSSTASNTAQYGSGFYVGTSAAYAFSNAATIQGQTYDARIARAGVGQILFAGTATNVAALAYSYPSTITTADSGADANHANTTLGFASNTVILDCDDDDGCTPVTTSLETGVAAGMKITYACESYHTDFTDVAGVLELEGGIAFVCNPGDNISFEYYTSAWWEKGRVDNTP